MSEQQRWFPQDPPPTARRLRKHALADAVRRLVGELVMLDVEKAEEHQLQALEDRLALTLQAFDDLPDVRDVGLHQSADDSSLFERSPLTGRSNALAAPLTLEFVGRSTRGHATYGEAYEGPPGLVHGGIVIAAFDDLLGVAQSASGLAGLTGTLEVKLRAPTPLHRRIDYEAGVTSRTDRKVVAWGRALLDGQVLAEATGIFVVPRGGHSLIDEAARQRLEALASEPQG